MEVHPERNTDVSLTTKFTKCLFRSRDVTVIDVGDHYDAGSEPHILQPWRHIHIFNTKLHFHWVYEWICVDLLLPLHAGYINIIDN